MDWKRILAHISGSVNEALLLRIEYLASEKRSPNLNAFAERWVRSIKKECLSRVILFGESALRRAISE